jgi:hypothetical protein
MARKISCMAAWKRQYRRTKREYVVVVGVDWQAGCRKHADEEMVRSKLNDSKPE